MSQDHNRYTFEISLSVLNHLGRNLYRSFITVLGEAISNSWDADAKNVWIYIDRESGSFVIKDDGIGMDTSDFQGKFLRVGYSKRKADGMLSDGGRPFIGAKGIGKLALLSCAGKVSILSKKIDTEYTGGVIDNTGLNEAIEHEITPDKYPLGEVNLEIFSSYAESHDKGTIIHFEDLKENIRNTIPYLRKLIAMHFKFSLIDPDFNIYVEDELVTHNDIKDLADSTEFLWKINSYTDSFLEEGLSSLKESVEISVGNTTATGFIASVVKPRHLKITGSNEKAGIDLFVNGRLREKDVLKHMPDFSTRFVASYLYGQIHFNELDNETTDKVFTSSREGVVDDNSQYKALIEIVKAEILESISTQWDEWRLKHDQIGDEENERNKSKKARYARSLFNESASGYKQAGNEDTKRVLQSLKSEAEFNVPAYTDCFLSENLLRKHISETGEVPTDCLNIDLSKQKCSDRKPGEHLSWCEYCRADRGKGSFLNLKEVAGTSIQIRASEDDVLMYMDYNDLAKITGNDILKDEEKPYKPLRNSVMHTALLTTEAKTRLSAIFDNVAATIKGIIGERS